MTAPCKDAIARHCVVYNAGASIHSSRDPILRALGHSSEDPCAERSRDSFEVGIMGFVTVAWYSNGDLSLHVRALGRPIPACA